MVAAASSGNASAAGVVWLLFIVVFYVVNALSLKRIAERTETADSWMAWVPILNTILLLHICKRSGWEILLLLVPFVGIVYLIVLMVWLPQRINRSGLWALALITPLALVALPYLAFSEADA